MALKAEYDNEADVPAELKAHYAEANGKWKPVWDGVAYGATDVATLQRTLEHEKKQRTEALKARDAINAELDPLKAKLTELEARPATTPEADKRLIDYRDEVEKRIKVLEAAAQEEKQKREKAETDLAEQSLFETLRKESSGLIREEALEDFLTTRVRPHLKKNDSGQWIPHDETGPRYSPTEPTRAMSYGEFVKWAADQPNAKYMAKPSSGGGAQGSRSGPNGVPFQMTRSQAKDFGAYERMATEAAKVGQSVTVVDG